MTACLEHDVLDDVYWYGSDGTATSAAMIEDTDVKSFAIDIGYPCTIFAPTQSEKWEMVHDYGMAELGRDLDSYSYAIYDIVWAYALSLLAVDEYDAEAVKEVLPTITESMFGASGWITLDEAGDREAGNYDIWQISATTQDWEITGQYILATDSVVWY
jgi:branched-chain amino acid transport system substrate-binding protein